MFCWWRFDMPWSIDAARRSLGVCALANLSACLGCGAASSAPLGDRGEVDSSVREDAPPGPGADATATQESSAPEPGARGDAGVQDADADAAESDDADASEVIGSPCVPLDESNSMFDGFDSREVALEPGSPGGARCLAYHFQGLVTCPYGQNAAGQAPVGASPCSTSGGQAVVGAVLPQCVERPATQDVVWSCRCANTAGATDDGYPYCTCPGSLSCTQTIPSTGAAEDEISGAYCLPADAFFDAAAPCTACDPTNHPCP